MEPNFDIPKDRKKISTLRLCLLMGATALLLLMVAHEVSAAGLV